MAVKGHPMSALKGTQQGRDLMNNVRSHRKGTSMKTSLTTTARSKDAAAGAAEPDGSYPIKNARDLANAYKDWIRAGRKPSDAAWIAKRAGELKLPNPITDTAPRSEMDVARSFNKRTKE